MSYKLKFTPVSWKEWGKLDRSLRSQFKRKLRERLENPHVAADKLRGFTAVYKIKLRASGYRLVYKVEDEAVTALVVAVGRRDHSEVYQKVKKKLRP